MPPEPQQRRRLAPAVLLGAGVPAALATAWLAPLPALSLRMALVACGVVGVAVGIRRHRPGRTRPWLLLLTGLSASLLGDVIVLTSFLADRLTSSVTLDAWLTAAAGVLLVAGVVDATGGLRREPDGILDAVVTALATGTLVWSLLVVPSAAPGWVGSSVEIAGSIQILLFAGLMALVTRAWVRLPSGGGRVSAGLALVALACATTAFLIGAVTDASGGVPYTGLRAAFGSLANLVMGAAALHPSMVGLTDRLEPRPPRLTGWRTVRLGTALLAPPGVLLWGTVTGQRISLVALIGAWLLLVPTVLASIHRLGRAQLEAERRTDATERRLMALVAHTGDVLLLVRHDGDRAAVVEFASPATRTLLDRDPETLSGTAVRDLVLPEDRPVLEAVLEQGASHLATADVRALRRGGDSRWMQVVADRYTGVGGPGALVVTMRDVAQRKADEQRWVAAALQDPGTGLANRRAIEDYLDSNLAPDGPTGPALAVLLCDLDDFKRINDRHGHAVGDAALREVGERLRRAVRTGDVVGRLGGDEFVVLCPLTRGDRSHLQVAERVVAELRRPLRVGDIEVSIACSVGAAVAPAGSTSPAEVLQAADLALYRAKAAGKGRVEWEDGRNPTLLTGA